MRDWVGVSLAAKGSFLEEMRALLAGSEIHLFEIWCHVLMFFAGMQPALRISIQNRLVELTNGC